MKFLGGEQFTEHASSFLAHEQGGGESIKCIRPAADPNHVYEGETILTRSDNLLTSDELMSADHEEQGEISFADGQDEGSGEEGEVEQRDENGPLPVAAESITDACQEEDLAEDGTREREEESSSPTVSSDEDSQRRSVSGGTETEVEEEEVVARSIVRCNKVVSKKRHRRRRGEDHPPLGILKGTSGRVNSRRVTFNEMMTVFMDGCPEVQVPAFRPWDLTFSEVCYMYEPPPEYRDWEGAFEPPDGYRDLDGVTTFDDGSFSSDEDHGTVPSARTQGPADTLFPMEDEDLSSGEFVVHRVTILEGDAEIVQLNEPLDPENDVVDESASSIVVVEAVPDNEVPTNEDCETSDALIAALEIQETEEETYDNVDNTYEDLKDEEIQEDAVSDNELKVETDEGESHHEMQQTAEEEDDDDVKSGGEETVQVSRTNSQIRRSLELSALRRSLLRGETQMLSARRRRQAVIKPKSPSSSGIEEKLRWLTSTEDLTTAGDSNSPSRSASALNNGPTRWTSELLYPSPSSNYPPGVPDRPHINQQLPYYRPPSRPASFDPHLGLIAWEGYLQQRDRTRAVYQRHIERHPKATDRPPATVPPRRPSNISDELEWFVQQDSERTERIKKRYSLSEEEDPTFGFGRRPSVRGIRPRFGSTTEILQQLQSQLLKRPPPNPNCLLYSSLPRNTSSGPVPFLPYPDLVRLPKVSEESLKKRDPVSIKRASSASDAGSVDSSGKGFVCKDERGAPEGASSSPRMSTDSLYAIGNNSKSGTSTQQTPKEDVVVYYSLRV